MTASQINRRPPPSKPGPLLRTESFYRYQLVLRTPRMAVLSRRLGELLPSLNLPDDVTLTVDVDPVSLA